MSAINSCTRKLTSNFSSFLLASQSNTVKEVKYFPSKEIPQVYIGKVKFNPERWAAEGLEGCRGPKPGWAPMFARDTARTQSQCRPVYLPPVR